jgi:hypothetical protein
VIKDAESADMVKSAHVGGLLFFCGRSTASMVMTASYEVYAQVKWLLVTAEDGTLGVDEGCLDQ